MVRCFAVGLLELELTLIAEVSKEEGRALGIFASIVGHLGDGNFHEAIMVNKKDPVEFAAVEKAVHNMVDRALEMEGTCTVSHFPCPGTLLKCVIGRTCCRNEQEKRFTAGSWRRYFGCYEESEAGIGSTLVDESWEDIRYTRLKK